MDRWKQYQTQHDHQARFGVLTGVWKIASSREFEQYQSQRLGELRNRPYHQGAKYKDRLAS
jgi:hypothetical protein